jgi:hypothetical protein
MATKKQGDRIGAMVKEVEKLAKQLRADVGKRAAATGLPKNLKAAADRLRKLAAALAAQVEKYAHEVRKDLEGGGKPARKRPRRRKKVPPPPAAAA